MRNHRRHRHPWMAFCRSWARTGYHHVTRCMCLRISIRHLYTPVDSHNDANLTSSTVSKK